MLAVRLRIGVAFVGYSVKKALPAAAGSSLLDAHARETLLVKRSLAVFVFDVFYLRLCYAQYKNNL